MCFVTMYVRCGCVLMFGFWLQLLPVVNFWSDGFQYPVGSAMKSAYSTVLVSSSRIASCV